MHVIFAVQRPNVRLGHLIRNSGEDFDSLSEQLKKLENRFNEEYQQEEDRDWMRSLDTRPLSMIGMHRSLRPIAQIAH